MTAGPWTLTNEGRSRLADGTYGNLTAANAVKVGLATSSSNLGSASTLYSSLTGEVAAANGYTTGGVAATLAETGTTSVALTLTASVQFAATGGSIVFRYYFIYEPSGHILAYCLGDATPADTTISSGNTETLSNSTAVLTLA
jgi:hypothetical protein